MTCLRVSTGDPEDSVARSCGAAAGWDIETPAPPLRRWRFMRFD